MLTLLFSGTNIKQEGVKIVVRNIYRKRGTRLPVKGESIICENRTNGKKFPGHVIEVNQDERRYDAEFDLSEEIQDESINLDETLDPSRELGVTLQGKKELSL
jgi:hypothetical protein